jgi:hypothetical protein
VRKYGIAGNIVVEVLGQAEFVTVVPLQKTHCSDQSRQEGMLSMNICIAESTCV